MPRGYPGSTLGVDPGGQGVIPRWFKRKKNFCDELTNIGRTDRLDNKYSDLELLEFLNILWKGLAILCINLKYFKIGKTGKSGLESIIFFSVS